MAVGDVAVMRLVGRFQDQNIVNTFHFEITEEVGDEKDVWQELVDEWETTYDAAWAARHSDAYTSVGLKAFTARGDTHPPGFTHMATAGGIVGDPQESFINRTITLYSDSPNPRVRGRLMLSGGDEAMFNDLDGSVDTTEVGLLDTLGALLIQGVSSGTNTYKMVLYNATLDTTADIISAKARMTPSILRSRRIRQFSIG